MMEWLNYTVTFWGAPLSVVELVAAVVGVAYVILQYKVNWWMWLCSLVVSLCFVYSCVVNRLYANGGINAYYIVMAVYGMYTWIRLRRQQDAKEHPAANQTVADDGDATLQCLTPRQWGWSLAVMAVLTGVLYLLLHLLGEGNTSSGIDLTILDSFTAAISIVATWMLAHKYYQHWICWIVVDPITAILYILAGCYPLAVLYIIYTIVSIAGYRRWKRDYRGASHPSTANDECQPNNKEKTNP